MELKGFFYYRTKATASGVQPLICEELLLHLLIRSQFPSQLLGDGLSQLLTSPHTSFFPANHKAFITFSYTSSPLKSFFFHLTIHLYLILLLLVILVDLSMFISPLLPLCHFFFTPIPTAILIEHLASCVPLSLALSYFLSLLRSLAPHALSPSLIFSFPKTPTAPFLHRPVADSISGNVVYEKTFHFPKPFVFKTLQGLSCFINLSDAAVSLNRSQNLQLNMLCWYTQQHHTNTHLHKSTNRPVHLASNKKNHIS